MDFFEHQEAARKKTRLLVFYFLMAVILIIAVLNLIGFLIVRSQTSPEYPFSITDWFQHSWFYAVTIGTLLLIVMGSLFRWFQLSAGGKAVASMVKAREILPDTNDLLERRLLNVVEEMSIASGTSVPTVYVMDEEETINAFVAGLETSDTVLVVTRGALENLTRQELQGVVAHEFSHIFNSDMRINVRLIAVLAGILLIGQAGYFVMRYIRYGNIRSSNKNGGNAVVAIFVIGISLFFIGYIGLFFGRLIKAAISRQREFLADASAVQYARDNEGLAGAFIKIRQQGSLLKNSHAEETSHMCISEPIKLNFSGLASHPPIEKRLMAIMPGWRNLAKQIEEQRLREMAQQQEYEDIELEKEEKPAMDFGFDAIVETIGQPTTLHQHAAGALLLALPEVIRQAAHSHHSNNHAMHLALALLLSDDNQMSEPVLNLIAEKTSQKDADQVLELAQHITKEQRHLRLAILDISIPSLRRLSATERKGFLSLLRQAIHLDSHISEFEYVLYSILQKNLSDSRQGPSNSIKRFSAVTHEIEVILSATIHSTGQSDEDKKALYSKLIQPFIKDPSPLLDKTFDAESFHQALKRLNQLTPMLKKPLIQALEDAVTHDGKVNPREIELLRAIAECLNCPIPPILEQAQESLVKGNNP